MKRLFTLILILFHFLNPILAQNVEIIILGIAQDAGYPQANCEKACCQAYYDGTAAKKNVASLGIIDLETNEFWLIDCTPDFKEQLKNITRSTGDSGNLPSGIFLTHAHIGHYTGLLELGHEVIGAEQVPVYAMPRMRNFIEKNGPWEQLVKYNNIDLRTLDANTRVELTKNLSITPFLVPHRDEYSETVGYLITSAEESLMYIPDIDKWEKWDRAIVEEVRKVDYAFLDGTFYGNNELPDRDMSQVPHPFVEESILKFENLTPLEKSKVYFTHLNHTNPLLNKKSLSYRSVFLNGFNVASEGMSLYLK